MLLASSYWWKQHANQIITVETARHPAVIHMPFLKQFVWRGTKRQQEGVATGTYWVVSDLEGGGRVEAEPYKGQPANDRYSNLAPHETKSRALPLH